MSNKRTSLVMLLPALLILSVFLFIPIVSGLYMSLEQTSLSGERQFVGLENYRLLLFEGQRIFTNLRVSLSYVLANIFLTIPFAYLIALLVTKNNGLARFFRSLYLIPWICAPVVSTLMVRSMLDPEMGIIHLAVKYLSGGDVFILNNSLYALLVMIFHSFWRSCPFIMLFLSAGMSTIPNEFYEAAKIDGAGKIKSFFHLTLPLTSNQLCIGVLMVTIWTIQDSESVYALTKGGPGYSTETLAVRLFKSSFVNFDLNAGAVIGILLITLSLVFMILYLKILLKGDLYG